MTPFKHFPLFVKRDNPVTEADLFRPHFDLYQSLNRLPI